MKFKYKNYLKIILSISQILILHKNCKIRIYNIYKYETSKNLPLSLHYFEKLFELYVLIEQNMNLKCTIFF